MKWSMLILITLFIGCISPQSINYSSTYRVPTNLDTLEGDFLYEVDVPVKAYSRFDQIEQGSNLIFFDNKFFDEDISKLYRKGVVFFQHQPVIADHITKNSISLQQDQNSVTIFSDSLRRFTLYGNKYLINPLLDKSKNFLYKKLKAKFIVASLGKINQLVPSSKNYQCCYSNTTRSIKSFFVTKVISFEFY